MKLTGINSHVDEEGKKIYFVKLKFKFFIRKNVFYFFRCEELQFSEYASRTLVNIFLAMRKQWNVR